MEYIARRNRITILISVAPSQKFWANAVYFNNLRPIKEDLEKITPMAIGGNH